MTHCVYDTTSRSSRVNFGDETEDEMCFDFLLVTPAITRRTCSTPMSDGRGEFALSDFSDSSGVSPLAVIMITVIVLIACIALGICVLCGVFSGLAARKLSSSESD